METDLGRSSRSEINPLWWKDVEKAVTYCGQEPGNKALGMFRYQDGNPKEVGLGYRETFRRAP